ncbi:MAG: hypothetical protein IJZ89_04355 [Clostridia bacterium]|nr:hypothetical protein [Clostridia bacterium]
MSGEICGTGLNRFCAIGKLHFYSRAVASRGCNMAEAAENDLIPIELSRLEIAIGNVREKYENDDSAESDFAVSILDDIHGKAREEIFRGIGAADSVRYVSEALFYELAESGDPYVSLRSAVCAEAGGYLAAELSGEKEKISLRSIKPVILIAENITVKELESLDRSMLLGLFLPNASPLSEDALYAHSFGIPLIVGSENRLEKEKLEGVDAVIDGEKGIILTEPESDVIEQYALRLGDLSVCRSSEKSAVKKLAVINCEADLDMFSAENSDGIGILNFESLLKSASPIEEERLYSLFRLAADSSGGKEVRILLPSKNEYLRKTVSAAMRAAVFGDFSVILPSVLSKADMQMVRGEIATMENDFSVELHVGALVRNGAVLTMCEDIAPLCDFLMIDCDSLFLSLLYPKRAEDIAPKDIAENSESLIRAAEMIIKVCKSSGTDIGICGMLAMRKRFYSRLLPLGIKEIALPPPYIGFV